MATNEVATQNGYEVATLGDGEVWVKRTSQGDIQSVRSILTLREDKKELCVIEKNPMITADGYYRLNQIASLAIITPDSIKIPDLEGGGARQVPNPFPIIDKESGTQRGVWVKKLAIGYSPIGSLVASSTTLFYDFSLYFLADLQKKVQYNKGAGRVCFESQLTDDERKKGIFQRIEGDFGVWANMEHPEVLKAVSTWIQSKQFGERKAQTVAERNALKHHPALSVKLSALQGPDKARTGQVLVVGWQHDLDRKGLDEIARAADAGEDLVIDGQRVEMTENSADVTVEDVVASDEMDPEAIPVDDDDTGDGSSGGKGLF